MNLFSTFVQRVAIMVVVLMMALFINAQERTFATIADMNAATDLNDGDRVKITGDVVFEYCYMYYFVVSDKGGTASCANNYCYYIRNIIEEQSIKAGDVFKNYSGTISISPSGAYRLEPDVVNKQFANGITIEHTSAPYEVKTTKVTVKDLLENPNLYDGKVVSLDEAITKNMGHTSYLIQGEDTLKSFTISGLNNDAYPVEIVIDRALFKVEVSGNGLLCMSQRDFGGAYKTVKSLKATTLTDDIKIDLNLHVIKVEEYEGKTYFTAYEGTGDKLIDYAGLRVLLNEVNAEDGKIKSGDIINIKSSTAQYAPSSKQSIYFTHSLLTLNAHETQILSNEPVKYNLIYPDNINMLEIFEFLPVDIYGVISLTGKENATHKEHNFAEATIADDTKIYVDIAKKPATVGNTFILSGCLEIPLWQEKASRTYVVPLSEKDFTSDCMPFDDIKTVVDFGVHENPAIKYQINSDMTITAISMIEAVGDEDNTQKVVFVCDANASLMLMNFNLEGYAVGDIITNVIGTYSDVVKTQITSAGERDFGVARCLHLDSASLTSIRRGNGIATTLPKEVTIADLLQNDDLASYIVEISDFTIDTVTEVVQDVTVDRYYLYQGEDSIAVDPSFANVEDKSKLVAIYYLNGFYTRLIPYTGRIGVSVDNVLVDNSLFVSNKIINAFGAQIEVYDIMGRFVAYGENTVNIEGVNQSVLVVRTKYTDGQIFVTKVLNY